jgi:hypothetical protein
MAEDKRLPKPKTHEQDLQTLYSAIDANLETLTEVGQKIQERKDKEWLASIPVTDTEELRKQWNMPRPQPLPAQTAPIISSKKSTIISGIEQKRKQVEAQLQRLQDKFSGAN